MLNIKYLWRHQLLFWQNPNWNPRKGNDGNWRNFCMSVTEKVV